MVFRVDYTNVDYCFGWLKSFKSLYERSFPNENEREDFDNIVDRVILGPNCKYLWSFLLLYIEDGKLVGGAIYDWYYDCKALELIYLIVKESHRNKGIGKKLFVDAVPMMHWFLNSEIKNVFFEVDNPELVDDDFAKVRKSIYEHWGAKQVNINYIQPPLSFSKRPVRNMLLYTLKELTNKQDLIAFLELFYKGLGYQDDDNFLLEMKKQIETL